MRLKTQVFLQSLFLGLGILALIAFGTHSLTSLNSDLQVLTDEHFGSIVNEELPQLNEYQDSIALLLNADRDAYQAHLVEHKILKASDAAELEDLRANSEENRQQVVDRVRKGAASLGANGAGLIEEFEGSYAEWQSLHVQLVDLGPEGARLLSPASTAFDTMRDVIDRMQEAQEKNIAACVARVEDVKTIAAASGERAQTQTATATRVFVTLGGVGFLLFITMGLLTGRKMASALERALLFAKGITHGDFNQTLEIKRKDEFGDLADALKEMQTSMRTSMEAIEKARAADLKKTTELEAAQTRQSAQAKELEQAAREQAATNAERMAMAEREAEQLQALEAQVDLILGVIETAATGDLRGELHLTGDAAISRVGMGVSNLLKELRTNFTSISKSAVVLNSSSSDLTGLSGGLNERAQITASEAEEMAMIAREVSASIDTVAAAAEEMEASIREISTQTSQGARIAGEAVERANTAGETMSQLDSATAEIRSIIKVITTIAEQTNLLALNATIEAARAGESGKGFAVVANEVKELAQATALATRDIADRIVAVESSSSAAIEAILDITKVIASINDIQGSVASAIEEQTATTGEIVRSVSGAAQGSNDIATRSTGLADTSKKTLLDVAASKQSASDLAVLAGDLTTMVSRYRL